VGDGPWESMEEFDDDIPARDFDNFQFVNFTSLLLRYPDPSQRAIQFALDALQELPDQYKLIKQKGLLNIQPQPNVRFNNRLVGKHHFRKSFVPGIQLEGISPVMTEGPPGGMNPPPYAPR
jgi:hypothetical protein